MQYYDFTIDGNRVGYFEIEEGPGELYMNARLFIEGAQHENPFWLRHTNGRPKQVKMRESVWYPVPDDTYPTCAYPLVLRGGLARYRACIEGTWELEDRELRSEDAIFVDRSGQRVMRKFALQGDQIVYICWGGTAESRVVDSRAEAVRGTVFDS